MMQIRDVGELKLIQQIANLLSAPPPEVLGIGDDCAVIPVTSEKSYLVTTDALIEGIHFLKDPCSAKSLGRKALAVNLSDIAAMGGEPCYALLTLSLPPATEMSWTQDFLSGLNETAREYGVSLIGGDTVGSLGAIAISITLIGVAAPEQIKLRSAAEAGDLVCVTQTLGDSAGGLKLILDQSSRGSPEITHLKRRHFEPLAQVQIGNWFASRPEVHAMMDLSDGLDSDIRKIMDRSGVGASIELAKLPVSRELQQVAQEENWDALELARTGGEDYGLLLTVDASKYAEIAGEYEEKFSTALHSIGHITDQAGKLEYRIRGETVRFSAQGFRHFS